jgi:predicted RNase H-like HicB family nuclease
MCHGLLCVRLFVTRHPATIRFPKRRFRPESSKRIAPQIAAGTGANEPAGGCGDVSLERESCSMADALYADLLEPDPLDGGFNVHLLTFPHASAQGENVEDALRNVREVLEVEIEVMIWRADVLPASDGDVPTPCVMASDTPQDIAPEETALLC